MCQTPIPADWERDRAAVLEIDGQSVIRHAIDDRSHSQPLRARLDRAHNSAMRFLIVGVCCRSPQSE